MALYQSITIFSVFFQLMAGFENKFDVDDEWLEPNPNQSAADDSLQTSFEEKPRRDLRERIAERSGFKPLSLNTENLLWSPGLTISSHGLSSATLLESPVFLSNSLPSPTTGKLPSIPFDRAKDEYFDEISRRSLDPRNIGGDFQDYHEQRQVTGLRDSVANDAPEDDGYNWRKYGQKLVKGCEYPRSYYKCTNPICQVKKKVERSQEGYITEIIYTGKHNHPKPLPHRRSGIGTYSPGLDMQRDGMERTQQRFTGSNQNIDWTFPVSDQGKHSYGSHFGSMQVQGGTQFAYGDGAADAFSRYEDDADNLSHMSVSLGYDGEVDESESKRRKHHVFAEEMSGTARAGREQKVVLHTTSDTDILDDGYRWRKYGQKVVKGNTNPRSYYKCTAHGCAVTKHVERSSDDLESVLTTYIGRHTHNVPSARNSRHISSGSRTGFLHGCFAAQTQDHHMHYPVPHSTPEGLPANSSLFDFQPHFRPPSFSYMGQTELSDFSMPGKEKLPSLPEPAFGDPAGLVLQLGAEPKVELPMSQPELETSRSSLNYSETMSRFPEI